MSNEVAATGFLVFRKLKVEKSSLNSRYESGPEKLACDIKLMTTSMEVIESRTVNAVALLELWASIAFKLVCEKIGVNSQTYSCHILSQLVTRVRVVIRACM